MAAEDGLALGLDFGTESVRAVLVDLAGNEHAGVVVRYRHGQIVGRLPDGGPPLPPGFALQRPRDWINAAVRATKRAVAEAGAGAERVIGIGVDFTSCTMLPCLADGTPLCELPELSGRPHA